MRTLATVTLLALAAGLAGCGGGDTPASEKLPEAHSYVLRIDAVTLENTTPGWEPWTEIPDDFQVGEEIRVDFEVDGDQIVAYASREWGSVHEYRGAADGAPLELEATEGSWGVSLNGAAGGGTNGSLRIQRMVVDAWVEDGVVAFSGVASFEGTADFFAGDVGWSYSAEGDLTGRVDDVAPRARFGRVSPLGALRPWEPVRLQLSEPVHRDQILGRVHASGGTLRTEFGDDPERVTSVVVYPTSWWTPEDSLEAWIQAGFADPEGNAGAETREGFPMMADVEPRASFDFEDAAGSAVTSWGDDAFDPPDWIECADASVGCLMLRRPESGTAGVYARLSSTSTFTRIRARVRVIGERSDFGFTGATLGLTMAAAGEGSTDEARLEQQVTADPDETVPEPYTSDTGFVTVEVELPSEVTSAGVVLHFADPYGYSDTSRGGSAGGSAGAPIPPAAPNVVVVDDIEVL